MTTINTDFKIFYSWQSDLPDATNRRAIRSAIRTASNKIEVELSSVRLVLDEATRDEPGSPNIPLTILEKIKSSDAFVCDITTINDSAPSDLRRTPNPNVLFELGYAVAYLGWGRIVMLFNEEHGSFPVDTPFDIDRHRASPFRIAATEKPNTAELANLLNTAIRAIVEKNPPKPFSMSPRSPEEIKRQRDIVNLKWILATIHVPTLNQMILDLPRYQRSRVLHFWESFNGVASNPLFHIYDEESLSTIQSIHKHWKICVSHGEQYHMAANPNLYVFANPGDMPLNDSQEKVWNTIELSRSALNESFRKLQKIVRASYLEIDLDEMNAAAWQEYVEFQRDIEREFERKET